MSAAADAAGSAWRRYAAALSPRALASALRGLLPSRQDAEAIEAVLAPTGVPLERHASLEAATRWCFGRARGGDAVLLSPACASLDMFRNYAHRAEVFVREVHSLVADDGGVIA